MQFSKIIGHTSVKSRLIQSVSDNRVSHAQLFSGPEGTGTLPLAIAYTQFLNCTEKLPDDSCGKCPSCLKMEKLAHPDVHFSYPVAGKERPKSVDFIAQWRETFLNNPYLEVNEWYESIDIETKQGSMNVYEASDLLRRLSLKSFESEYKTAIIWLPEKMGTEASNKLLKIIEEPPDKTLFLLVTENAGQIIPTILSRTQLVKTSRPADGEIKEALVTHFEITPDEADKIVHMCDGNYNVARKLTGDDNKSQQVEKEFLEWMRVCFSPLKNYSALLEKMDRFAKLNKEERKNYLSFSISVIRECIMMNFELSALQRFGEEGNAYFQRFSQQIHLNNANLFIEELNKAYFHTGRNANAKILFLDLSFKIHRILTIKKPETETSIA